MSTQDSTLADEICCGSPRMAIRHGNPPNHIGVSSGLTRMLVSHQPKTCNMLQHDDFSGLRLRPTWFRPPHQRPASSAILCTVKLKLWMGLGLLSKGFQSGSRLFSQMGKWWKWDDIWWFWWFWWLIFEGLLQPFAVSSEHLRTKSLPWPIWLPATRLVCGTTWPQRHGKWWRVVESGQQRQCRMNDFLEFQCFSDSNSVHFAVSYRLLSWKS